MNRRIDSIGALQTLLAKIRAEGPTLAFSELRDSIESVASLLLKDADVTRPPVSLSKIAYESGIRVVTISDTAVDGLLLPLEGSGYQVVLNPQHRGVRRRFSLAHEIMHALLATPGTQLRDTSDHNFNAGHTELVCNMFAAAVLMPRDFLGEFLKERPSWGLVKEIAARFQVSFEAAARRLVFLTSYSAMLVKWSTDVLNECTLHLESALYSESCKARVGNGDQKAWPVVSKTLSAGLSEFSDYDVVPLVNANGPVPVAVKVFGHQPRQTVFVLVAQ